MFWILLGCVALGAYFLGSIPSGYLVGRARGIDLRKEGSKNIGATNAVRVLGKKLGYVVFAADVLKGILAVQIAYKVGEAIFPEKAIYEGIVAAAMVMVGHIFPVWLNFHGGKGIATAAGVMIGLFPIWVFLAGITLWTILFLTTRYVSIASIAAAISLPTSTGILVWMGICDIRLFPVAFIMCVLAVWRHKENIERLLSGTEKRFEKKKPVAQA